MSRPEALTAAGRALLAGGALALLAGAALNSALAMVVGAGALALLAAAQLDLARRVATLRRLGVSVALPPDARRGEPVVVLLHLVRADAGPTLPVTIGVRAIGACPMPPIRTRIPGAARATIPLHLTFPRAGRWAIHGVSLLVHGRWDLARLALYKPEERAIRVAPRAQAPRSAPPAVATGLPTDARRRARPGDDGDLLELRDYRPGDPVRAIAWRASARRGRPLVRQPEDCRAPSRHLILDIGPPMRRGPPGEAPLDQALDALAGLIAAGGPGRLGLTTYDHRIYGHLQGDVGRAHAARLLRHLLDLHQVVDADLTEIAAGELIWRVGHFLEQQTRSPLRRPGAARPLALRAAVDPLAEQFDPGRLFEAATAALAAARPAARAALHAKARPAADLFEARLRLLCALRCVPLPYRLTSEPAAREAGLRAALLRALTGPRPDEIHLFADLSALTSGGPALGALRRLAAQGVQIHARGPAPPAEVRALLRGARISCQA